MKRFCTILAALALAGSVAEAAYNRKFRGFIKQASDADAAAGTDDTVFPSVAQVASMIGTLGDGNAWFAGEGAPNSGTGSDGDYYLNTSNGDVYQKSAGSWGSSVANIRGPQGIQGETGTTGSAGASAYLYVAYASAADGTGFTTTYNSSLDYIAFRATSSPIASPVAGDFAGLWKNYKGATGSQGIQGVAGQDGQAGADGTDGTDGADGRTTWYTASGTPNDATGVDGDFMWRGSDGSLFLKAGGTWGSAVYSLSNVETLNITTLNLTNPLAIASLALYHSAAADPGTGDDTGDGYVLGSRWVNTSTDEEFVCTDNSSGAAVWQSTTDTGAGFSETSLASLVNSQTLWDGSQASRTLTINLSGTDPVFTFSSGVVNLSAGALQVGGVAVELGNSNNIDPDRLNGDTTDNDALDIAAGGTGATSAAAAFSALKQAASTTATGVVELATDGETASGVVVQGNDGRLANNARTNASNTLVGTQLLSEGASLGLDAASSADGAYSGITRTGTAGATLAFGDLVVLDATDSRWELADANSAAAADGDSRGLIGICVQAAASDGSATTVLLSGIVRADAVFPALTINGPIYISETAGDITQTVPTTTDAVIRPLGAAWTADEIYFNPAAGYDTHD